MCLPLPEHIIYHKRDQAAPQLGIIIGQATMFLSTQAKYGSTWCLFVRGQLLCSSHLSHSCKACALLVFAPEI